MKNIRPHILLITSTLLLVLFTFACGNRKHESNRIDRVKKKSDKELQLALENQAEIPFDFLTTRISVDLKSTTRDASFSCYLKLDVDSIFGGSIKLGPVVFATYQITTDSIIFVNKREDCYFKESLAYISSLFGTEIEFNFFQQLLTGRPIGYDPDIKYKQIDAGDHYILSSHKKKIYKKLESDRFEPKEDFMLIQYHLEAESLKTKQINVQVPADTTDIEIIYKERKMVDEHEVPEEMTVLITNPKDTLFMRLNYGTVKLNEPKSISINIPDSYSECR